MGRIVSFENSIEINEMGEQDAITLLVTTSGLDASFEHLKSAKEIVNELGCIPLAVNQAGAYIEAGKCDINNYLRQLSLHLQTLLSHVGFKGESGYNQTVYGTWDLSYREIERRVGKCKEVKNLVLRKHKQHKLQFKFFKYVLSIIIVISL